MDKRIRILKDIPLKQGAAAYWMSRDQRLEDNWALLYAQKQALASKAPLYVFFYLAPGFLAAAARQYDFMLKGLEEVAGKAADLNIDFRILRGDLNSAILNYLEENNIRLLVTDFDPLRIKKNWKNKILADIPIPVHEVDAHNIIPCWQTSSKQEYAAYTIRNKIKKLLPEYLTDFPALIRHPFGTRPDSAESIGFPGKSYFTFSATPEPVKWITPGSVAAARTLDHFISNNLALYDQNRNDPNSDVQSGLSPYLHFGQISAARVALRIKAGDTDENASSAFLEELIVRKELSDNFCYYNHDYDKLQGAPQWAQKTLLAHAADRREYEYRLSELENAETHDSLWNAAQTEMVIRGKMPGYLRMYWAKKLLEWTGDPQTAIDHAIYLNDKYELDGRDPNGYSGILWSIAGVHDRPWFERKIFGKIRFMSYNGCARKFSIADYIDRVARIVKES